MSVFTELIIHYKLRYMAAQRSDLIVQLTKKNQCWKKLIKQICSVEEFSTINQEDYFIPESLLFKFMGKKKPTI